MTQSQILLFTIAAIPFLNCLALKFCDKSPILQNFSNKFFPLLFLANLIGLYGNVESGSSLVLLEAMRGISLGFFIDKMVLGFLFCLNFFWLILVFYSQRFLQINPLKNSNELKLFFTLIVAFLTLIIISKNLISTLFFYNCLIFLCYFFALNFLRKSDTKLSRLFMISLYLESVFFFLAIVATYKFSTQIDFSGDALISKSQGNALLLLLYVIGLFSSALIPFYLIYRISINLEPLLLYAFFFLAYGFGSLCIFIKLLTFIFGFEEFSALMTGDLFRFFEMLFLVNILAASGFLLFSRGIKASFFYLFFQQFIFALFTIFFFGAFDATRIYLALYSFFLDFTLVFLALSNLVLYLTKAEDKKLYGLFYQLTISCSFLIFAFGDMIGIVPGVGLIEKFFIAKIILQKKLWISAAILFVNCATLFLFFCKIFLPMFSHPLGARPVEDSNLAKDIDFDSSLILTASVTAVLIFLGLIFFPFIGNFFS